MMAAGFSDVRTEMAPRLCEDWLLLDWDECLDSEDGKQNAKLKQSQYLRVGKYPVIDQGQDPIAGFVDDPELTYRGELPIIIFGDHTRAVKYIDFPFAVGADGCKLIRPLASFDKRFFYYYLRSLDIVSEGYSRHYKFLKAIKVPLPPIGEQKRIVVKLDAILPRVKGAKAWLEKIPVILKRFRQSVLAAACSGRLTEDWREENPDVVPVIAEIIEDSPYDLPSTWTWSSLRALTDGFQYGTSSKSQKEGEIPVLRMGNLQEGMIDWSSLKYTSDKSEIIKYKLIAGDILFNRTNSPDLVGKTSLYRGERPAIFAGYLIKIRNKKNRLLSEYLNMCLNTEQAREWCRQVKTDGVSQSNINAQVLSTFLIPLPPLGEQAEIVRRVEKLFKLADSLEAKYRKAMERVGKIEQSVLAKAFRGELVEADPNDEPAQELLKRILAEKAKLEGQRKPRRKK